MLLNFRVFPCKHWVTWVSALNLPFAGNKFLGSSGMTITKTFCDRFAGSLRLKPIHYEPRSGTVSSVVDSLSRTAFLLSSVNCAYMETITSKVPVSPFAKEKEDDVFLWPWERRLCELRRL